MTEKTKENIWLVLFILIAGVVGYYRAASYDAKPLDAFLKGALVYGGSAVAMSVLCLMYRASNSK